MNLLGDGFSGCGCRAQHKVFPGLLLGSKQGSGAACGLHDLVGSEVKGGRDHTAFMFK